jgi:hypothetical protein
MVTTQKTNVFLVDEIVVMQSWLIGDAPYLVRVTPYIDLHSITRKSTKKEIQLFESLESPEVWFVPLKENLMSISHSKVSKGNKEVLMA